MNGFFSGLGIGLLAAVVAAVTWRLARRGRSRRPAAKAGVQSFVTSMQAVGELSVFRIMTKEVITASDHWFGEFGRKYLSWLLSSQRITLIMEFDVDFRYDLNDPGFVCRSAGEGRYRLTLPPCRHEVLIRDLRIHSEDKPELLPWLMPDLLGRFFTGGFSVDAKNQLIAETREESRRFAAALVRKANSEAQASAVRTLRAVASGFGAREVEIEFTPAEKFAPKVDSSRLEAAGEGE